MTIEIPAPVIYMAAGAIVDRLIKVITGKDIIANVLYYFDEKQRLKEIEARRVVDIMGDTLVILMIMVIL